MFNTTSPRHDEQKDDQREKVLRSLEEQLEVLLRQEKKLDQYDEDIHQLEEKFIPSPTPPGIYWKIESSKYFIKKHLICLMWIDFVGSLDSGDGNDDDDDDGGDDEDQSVGLGHASPPGKIFFLYLRVVSSFAHFEQFFLFYRITTSTPSWIWSNTTK